MKDLFPPLAIFDVKLSRVTNSGGKVEAFIYDRFQLHVIFAAPFSPESKRKA